MHCMAERIGGLRSPRTRKNWIVGMVVVTVLALVFAGSAGIIALTQDGQDHYVSTYEPPATIDSNFSQLTDVGPQLADVGVPRVFAVLGDSTGNEQSEFIYVLGRQISELYNRPVIIHDWSVETNTYLGQNTLGADRPNAPVTIWNGSASGKDAGYSIQFLQALAPEPADLVLINHAHNHTTPDAAVQGVDNLLSRVRGAWPNTLPTIGVLLQNPRLDASADNQEAKVAALRVKFGNRADVEVVDVWQAFEDAPELAPLIRDDDFQPSDEGQTLWARTLGAALNLSTP